MALLVGARVTGPVAMLLFGVLIWHGESGWRRPRSGTCTCS